MTDVKVFDRGVTRWLLGLVVALLAGMLVAQVARADHEANQLSESERQQIIDADVANWIAKGEYYAGRSGFDYAAAADAQAAYWVAKGTYLADQAEAIRQQAIASDVANWIAKGRYYTGE